MGWWRCISVFVLSVVLLVPAVCAGKISTEAQARARVRQFISAVKWSVLTGIRVQRTKYYQTPQAWEGTFTIHTPTREEAIKMIIDGRTSRVLLVANDAVRLQTGAEKIITAARANAVAEKYLIAAGMPMKELRRVTSELYTPPAFSSNKNLWRVVYHRCYQGYPFMGDDVTIELNPYDASLELLRAHPFTNPLPASTRVVITQEQAKALARAFFTARKTPVYAVDSAKLYITQPTGFFEGKTDGPLTPITSRLAWVVIFEREKEEHHVIGAYVDAETGKIIGGVACL